MSQGDLSLLEDPISQQLLNDQTIMRFAYSWVDGTPRVVPHWFHWDGQHIVLASPAESPKVRALQNNGTVALTIDTTEFPPRVVLIRGTAEVSVVDGPPDEFAQTSRRYFGAEQGVAWVQQARALTADWARISVTPTWVSVLDYETRYPSALMRGMRSSANR
jgi:hypothetical protein